MPASFEGAIRVVKYRKTNSADCWIPVPAFWSSYCMAHFRTAAPSSVRIDMNEEGVLTITPLWPREEEPQNIPENAPEKDLTSPPKL